MKDSTLAKDCAGVKAGGYVLDIVDSVAALTQEQFDGLHGPDVYPFLRLSWLRAFETSQTVGGRSGWVPRHLVLMKANQLIAFVPGYIKLHSFGEFVFDQSWAQCSELQLGAPYYPKFVVGVPFTPATGPRFLLQRTLAVEERTSIIELLAAALAELLEEMQLSSAHVLFCDAPLAGALVKSGWTERLGIQYQFHNNGVADFEEFLSGLRAKRRANIRRERRVVVERGFTIETRSGSELHAEDALLSYELYLTTVDKYVWGRRYLNQQFFETVFREMPEILHLVTAKDSTGRVVAGAFNLLGQDAIFGRYWGTFVDEPFLHFEVCLYSGIEDTLRRGLQRFEAGAGGEHKHGRGLVPTLTRSVHLIRHPTLAQLVSDFCDREGKQVKQLLAQP